MRDDVKRAHDNLVFDNRPSWNHDLIAGVSDDDDSPLESSVATKGHITGNRKMVELEDIRNTTKSFQILANLLELRSQFDNGGSRKLASWVHDEGSRLESVHIALNEQEIRGRLDRQKAATWDVDTTSVVEVGNGGTDGGLELDDLLTGHLLVVNDDIKLHLVCLHDALDGAKRHPNIVGVEDLKLGHGLELLDILRGHLRNLKEGDLTVVGNNGTSLNIGAGLVGELHAVLDLAIDDVLEDVEIDGGAKVVDVRHEDVLLALGEKRVDEPRAVDGLEEITVARRVPILMYVAVVGDGHRFERLLDNTGITRLLESGNGDISVGVLLDDFGSLLICVEGIHKQEWNISLGVLLVEMFNLLDNKIQEGSITSNLNDALRPLTTHRGTQSSIQLENGKLAQQGTLLSCSRVGEGTVLLYHVLGGLFDEIPLDLLLGGATYHVAVVELEETLELVGAHLAEVVRSGGVHLAQLGLDNVDCGLVHDTLEILQRLAVHGRAVRG